MSIHPLIFIVYPVGLGILGISTNPDALATDVIVNDKLSIITDSRVSMRLLRTNLCVAQKSQDFLPDFLAISMDS